MMNGKTLALALMLGTAMAGTARAGNCEANLTSQGVAMVTPLSYKSFDIIPGVSAQQALSNLAAALAAENANDIRVNKAAGIVDATQESSGSGRVQKWRAVVRKAGRGVRVDLIFTTQLGQVTTVGAVKPVLCRVIAAAKG